MLRSRGLMEMLACEASRELVLCAGAVRKRRGEKPCLRRFTVGAEAPAQVPMSKTVDTCMPWHEEHQGLRRVCWRWL